MATTYNFTAPKTVTITAKSPAAIAIADAGSYTGPGAVATGSVAYVNQDVEIPLHASNVTKVIPKGDIVTLTASYSDEIAFYKSLEETLPVTVALS